MPSPQACAKTKGEVCHTDQRPGCATGLLCKPQQAGWSNGHQTVVFQPQFDGVCVTKTSTCNKDMYKILRVQEKVKYKKKKLDKRLQKIEAKLGRLELECYSPPTPQPAPTSPSLQTNPSRWLGCWAGWTLFTRQSFSNRFWPALFLLNNLSGNDLKLHVQEMPGRWWEMEMGHGRAE